MAESTAQMLLSGDGLPAELQVSRYEAREALSRPFEVEIDFSTDDTSFRVTAVFKKPLLLTLVDERGETRHFHGIVDTAEFVDFADDRLVFRVRLVPALAALAHREDCRIFQDKSIVDIVKKILADAGVDDHVEWKLASDAEQREYVVQWKESELNFMHRLFEDYGIFYFFRHTPEAHTMVIGDDPDVFAPSDDAPAVTFAMTSGLTVIGEPLHEFTRARAVRTTDVTVRDYDFEKPQGKPEGNLGAPDALPAGYYEYPGGFVQQGAGAVRARSRLRSLRRDADTCHGQSRAIGLRCGVPFTVEGGIPSYVNGDFVVTELRTSGRQTVDNPEQNYVCKNDFRGIPKGVAWAPPLVAKRPRIRGVQTATVMLPAAEEEGIHCDKYGRIKVRFHWDRIGQNDDKATCWLRTLQVPQGGTMIIPRFSWEVAVAFFEGDPDRPFVLGKVYNGEKTAPYALPGAAASGAVKSHSTPGGGGYNEIKMSDSGGSQGYGIAAEKDLNINIGHDKNETIAVDETHKVTQNMKATIGANDKLEVGANQTITTGSVMSNKVSGGQTIKVGGNETMNATANMVEHVGGDRSYKVSGNSITISNAVTQTLEGDFKRTVGAVQLDGSVASISDNYGGNYTENVGAVKLELVKGTDAETVGGNKSQTSLAAELHLVKGNFDTSSAGGTSHLIGGLHYQNIAGDYTVAAPMISLLGAVGVFKGGGSELKLGGGPITIKGSKIAMEGAMIIKMGASLKLGAG